MADEYEFVHVLSSGSYSDYRVHCALASSEDADAAAEALNAGSRCGDYYAEKLPVMPAGHVPTKKITYECSISPISLLAGADGKVSVTDYERWEWEDLGLPDATEIPPRGDQLARFHGTDKDAVRAAAQQRLDQLRADKEADR